MKVMNPQHLIIGTILMLSLIVPHLNAAPGPDAGSAKRKQISEKKQEVRKKKVKRKKRVKKKSQHRKSKVTYKKKKKRKNRVRVRRSLNSWLNKMKKRVARSHAKHNQIVAVGAVRGGETPSAPPLYWKGKKSSGPVDLPELEEFDAAIATAIEGKSKESITKLESFVATYPNSSLVADANHTIGILRKDQASQAP